jgi:hypothetical protein
MSATPAPPSVDDLDELMRTVWAPFRLSEPTSPEERIERAWGEISAASGLAGAAIEVLRSQLDAEGLSEGARCRALGHELISGIPNVAER